LIGVSRVWHHPGDYVHRGPDAKSEFRYVFRDPEWKRRQDFPAVWVITGALYIASVDYLRQRKTFSDERSYLYEMAEETMVDIDSPFDLSIERGLVAVGAVELAESYRDARAFLRRARARADEPRTAAVWGGGPLAVIGTSRASQASEPEPRLGAVDAEYRADVDGLRGVAIALVCLFHADLWPFTGGYVGVDVFFVISGFVITWVLLRDLERGSLSVPRFLLRRVRRLAPAAIVMLIVCMAIFTLVYPPKYLVGFGESTVAQSLFASNVYFWRTTDYFGTPPDARPLLHTWSLAVEEQFYLLFSVGIV
jgi:hypothetical protein